MTTRPRTNHQGKAIVERAGPRALLAMTPDGCVFKERTPRAALQTIARWFAAHADADSCNVGVIEWRDGIKPPAR